MMSSPRPPFFGEDWRSRVVSFSQVPSDSWKLGDKLSEKFDQWDAYFTRMNSAVSEAWGTFICSNVLDDREAIIKIRMQ